MISLKSMITPLFATLTIIVLAAFPGWQQVSANDDASTLNEVLEAEYLALTAFYHATDGGLWKNNSGWLGERGTQCDWYGVSCDSDGRIFSLYLVDNGLGGSIPEEIGMLSTIYYINLSYSYISGVHEKLFELDSLIHLRLNNNNIGGQIPATISNLKNLTLLDLSKNNFSGTIPPELYTLPVLEELSLFENAFSGPLSASIGDLKNLRTLNLDHNQLSGELPSRLGELNQLLHLYLEDNKFTGPIPPSIYSLNRLVSLYLRGNSLTGSLSPDIGNLSRVEWLDLSKNELSGNLPLQLSNLTTLRLLRVDDNQLTGPIPESLSQLSRMYFLDIARNRLTGFIPAELFGMPSLEYFNYSGNEFGVAEREALISMYESMGGLHWINKKGWLGEPGTECTWYGIDCYDGKVIEIDLNSNNAWGEIPVQIANFENLRFLKLGRNHLTGSIPDEVYTLSSLRELSLYGNDLTGGLSPAIGNLINLTSLDLATNKISGAIPVELGNLQDLNYLWLSENNLSGSIPESLGGLANLRLLLLQDNQLAGNIPESFNRLANLEALLVSNNGLSGTVPESVLNLPRLEFYNFDENQLEGIQNKPFQPIASSERDALIAFYDATDGDNWTDNTDWLGGPGTECDWYGVGCLEGRVVSIELPSNNLKGQIPAQIANFQKLRFLWLGDNYLTGSIPEEIYNLIDLRKVSLFGNSDLGGLSPDIGKLVKLTLLDLASTNISGPIPAELGNLLDLELLGLEKTKISGSIPDSLGNLVNLRLLLLHENQLSGNLPESLDKLVNLEVFYVHGNQLTGKIPKSIRGLPNLELSRFYRNQFEVETGGSSDRNVLLALYSATGGANWTNNAGWLGESGTECGWHGVTCTDQRVTALEVNDNNLSGTLPSQLGELTELRQLALNNNALSGEIPAELLSLTKLERLELQDNQFSGDLPDGLGNLPQLTTFDVSGNPDLLMAVSNVPPVVSIVGGDRTVADTDAKAGEQVQITATATDSDGAIISTHWLIDQVIVADGLTASIQLPDGDTVVIFRASDDKGETTSVTATIKVQAPVAIDHGPWQGSFNGVTPRPSLGLPFNNIGTLDIGAMRIFSCVRFLNNGEQIEFEGSAQMDILFDIVSMDEGTIQVVGSRLFNSNGATNELGNLPDCSGEFEFTNNRFSDFIQFGNETFKVVFELIDDIMLLFRIADLTEL